MKAFARKYPRASVWVTPGQYGPFGTCGLTAASAKLGYRVDGVLPIGALTLTVTLTLTLTLTVTVTLTVTLSQTLTLTLTLTRTRTRTRTLTRTLTLT